MRRAVSCRTWAWVMRCGVIGTSASADQSLSLSAARSCLTCPNAEASSRRADTRADTAPSWVPPSPYVSRRWFWLVARPDRALDLVAVEAVALLADAAYIGGGRHGGSE